ncbi:peptide ABC transporter substrate-binding protein [Apilactobacillus timberlakei]|uniref:peptide ABC transporter substrate-binding protein n=1 Tax=Apilactobacillus timberlakei TaxID=2008380 RepID=UPI00112D1BF5|nr:peptide ABC transporter substrate-binding protein [Apilactobacillus timberlakei]TPR17538.1 peptide ABC transporter substrate-binding protein [Apilactobacillus timberlakei]TPR20129.1 peptide ABC transporter substrate-binding protein [Apilactobacillus timberlakei]TPR20442.1 peptide ABC transporter substrate-binding protein [Apilactobacillus timberlakei]TPR21847.1 peptide ABC transporter substrate-binding protein [Apilactobacillus timberlakei]TPR24030.1 peptide ABC transporter substrate-bindin
MNFYKALLSSALLITAGGVLTACGNNATSKSKSQTLNLSANSRLDTIDISKSGGYGSTGNVYESFYRLGEKGAITPGLASKGYSSRDGKTWTFKIRSAKFSNGDPITANDFVYSWRRTVNPKTKAQYSYLFNAVKNGQQINAGNMSPNKLGIKAIDKHTVQINLNKPVAYFKTLMAYPLFGPQSKKTVQKYGSKYGTNSKYMVYSGPFKIVNWNGVGDKWSYVKNNNYWDKKAVKLNRINYSFVSDSTTSLNLYNQGLLDVTPLATDQLQNYRNDNTMKDYSYSMISYLRYNFNSQNKALHNKNIRRAISLSIDRSVLSQKVLYLKGSSEVTGFVPKGLAYNPINKKDFSEQQSVNDTLNYNPKLAKALFKKGLKELGMNSVSINLSNSNDNNNSNVAAQYLKEQLESNLKGMKVQLTSLPAKIYTQNEQDGKFDVGLDTWGGDFNDPITFLQIPQKGTPYNYGKYENNKYDNLINKAENEDANNQGKRWDDLIDASKELSKDQGVTPLFQNSAYYLQKNNIHGIIHNTAGTQWNYKYAYIG